LIGQSVILSGIWQEGKQCIRRKIVVIFCVRFLIAFCNLDLYSGANMEVRKEFYQRMEKIWIVFVFL
jgi:hypothetical protein